MLQNPPVCVVDAFTRRRAFEQIHEIPIAKNAPKAVVRIFMPLKPSSLPPSSPIVRVLGGSLPQPPLFVDANDVVHADLKLPL